MVCIRMARPRETRGAKVEDEYICNRTTEGESRLLGRVKTKYQRANEDKELDRKSRRGA